MSMPDGAAHLLAAAFGFVVADGLAVPDGPVVGFVPGFDPPLPVCDPDPDPDPELPVVRVLSGAVTRRVAVAVAALPVIAPGPWLPLAVKYKLTAV